MKKINRILSPYFLAIYLLFILTTGLFTLRIGKWDMATILIILPSLFFYPFCQLLPAAAFSQLAAFLSRKKEKLQLTVTGIVTVFMVYTVHLFLLLDAGLYFRYGYHVNPHVINIFTTPGGFAGMGLSNGEITLLAAGIALLALIHAGLFVLFVKVPKLHFQLVNSWRAPAVIVPVMALCFAISYFSYTYAHYTMNPKPLLAAESIPFYFKGTSGSLYESLGLAKPERDAVMIKLADDVHLDSYPAKEIRRRADRKKYNIVWLTCESWAARLFSAEIMPQTSEFAKKGVLFTNHYSGGNVTRQGVFSMFYGLPGNYWHAFLAARRGPLFIDWLNEDNYRIKCITSSKFTYPEFDQTVFFNVPQKDLHSDSEGLSYERDQRNLKLLLKSIDEGANSGKPFFSFMFFESTHHPYSFPPEAKLYADCIEPFNAVNATMENREAIFKRAANTARHLDMCLGEVFKLLDEKKLLDNTIVVLAGDHGEEYFEKGRLGHSSTFNNEQTRTTLILYYPGIKPGTYDKMSSHLDIVPMIAGHLGVENDPQDYSCGFDLLAANAPERRYCLIANWDEVFFAGTKYKSLIPLNAASMAKQTITDADDRELPDVDPFYKEYNQDLIKVQHDLTRFTAPGTAKNSSSGGLLLLIILPAAVIIAAAVILIRKKQRTGLPQDK